MPSVAEYVKLRKLHLTSVRSTTLSAAKRLVGLTDPDTIGAPHQLVTRIRGT
jgi:hypothetical protein